MSIAHALRLVSALALTVVVTSGAQAQSSPRTFPLRVPPQPVSTDGTIQVSVGYSLNFPIPSDDAKAQADTLEQGRRALYGIAAGECKVLMETIARTCTIERLNVQSNVRRQNGRDAVYVTGNASYRVALK